MDASSAAQATADLSTLVDAYRPLPGVFDEMVDGSGRLRPHWLPFLGMLAGLGQEETSRRLPLRTVICAIPACSTASTRTPPG
jgi:hypothetical protein